MKVQLVDKMGSRKGETLELADTTFGVAFNEPLVHQVVTAYLAAARSGTKAQKNRSDVSGSGKKPWKQKGTGRARQGSIRAPNWVGGGTVFGPIPRSYAQYVPRQVRALARKSALNARARENAIYVIDRFDYDAPKTSRLKALVDRLGVSDQKVLILTDGVKTNVFLSGRNLPTVHVMPYSDVSTYHILWSDVVLIEAGALGQTLAPIAEERIAERPSRATKNVAAKSAAKKSAKAAAAPVAKKAAKKSTAKRAAKAAKKTSAKKTAPKKSAAKKSTKKKGK
jgi:large subunit ribosomal protein L4